MLQDGGRDKAPGGYDAVTMIHCACLPSSDILDHSESAGRAQCAGELALCSNSDGTGQWVLRWWWGACTEAAAWVDVSNADPQLQRAEGSPARHHGRRGASKNLQAGDLQDDRIVDWTTNVVQVVSHLRWCSRLDGGRVVVADLNTRDSCRGQYPASALFCLKAKRH
jgi:hypothetical protein